jgi:hypothetical protein
VCPVCIRPCDQHSFTTSLLPSLFSQSTSPPLTLRHSQTPTPAFRQHARFPSARPQLEHQLRHLKRRHQLETLQGNSIPRSAPPLIGSSSSHPLRPRNRSQQTLPNHCRSIHLIWRGANKAQACGAVICAQEGCASSVFGVPCPCQHI